MEENKSTGILNIPTAIIIAGAIIAISVIYTKGTSTSVKVDRNDSVASINSAFKAVSNDDHILGSPSAKIKIVEYSDPSCPFCKSFHNTMKKVISDYGKSGNVAWVYRHYPLDKADASGNILHPNAGKEAQATECAASLGGNEKFWSFTNRLYEITPSVTGNSPKGLDQKELPKIAGYIGLNVDDFNNCLATSKFKDKVEKDFMDGVNIGIQGTPTSVIVLDKAINSSIKEKLMQIYEPYKDPNSGQYPISIDTDNKHIMMGGAIPLDTVKATIDLLFTY